MRKIARLKICNRSLLVSAVAVLVSGIQLEATHSMGIMSVWLHVVIGLLFMGLVAYHIYLHFGRSNWFAKFSQLRSQATRILWWVTLITLISGIIAVIHRTATFGHSVIGGIHGKLGFLMIALSLAHVCKRARFFLSNGSRKA